MDGKVAAWLEDNVSPHVRQKLWGKRVSPLRISVPPQKESVLVHLDSDSKKHFFWAAPQVWRKKWPNRKWKPFFAFKSVNILVFPPWKVFIPGCVRSPPPSNILKFKVLSKTKKVSSLFPDQEKFVNTNVINNMLSIPSQCKTISTSSIWRK